MKKRNGILFALALLIMVGGALWLRDFRGRQRLGEPGVKIRLDRDKPGGLEVLLPERVLDYDSQPVPTDDLVLAVLPKDTSYGQRRYQNPEGFELLMNVVLMGADRTSLHKPQFCLSGQGWNIDAAQSAETSIHIDRPASYDLPVIRLNMSKDLNVRGQTMNASGIYVYWYVADGMVSATTSGYQRMWWMARDLLRTGVLQRWAYVTCFAVCPPGQEDATYARMKTFIANAAPEFLIAPKTGELALHQ